MLDTVWDADFEEKAFAAWCAGGSGVNFGEYLEQCRAQREPPKNSEEIYREVDDLFEGR